MRAAFDRRRQTIVSMLREIPGVACPEPQGAFYVYPSVKGLLGRSIGGRTANDSVELAELILEQAEVAVVPGEAFGTPGYLRLSYALGRRRPGRGRQPACSACSATAGLTPQCGRSAGRGPRSSQHGERLGQVGQRGGHVVRRRDRPGVRVDVAADRRVERLGPGRPRGPPAARPPPCRRRVRSTAARRVEVVHRLPPTSPGTPSAARGPRPTRVDDGLGPGRERLVQPRVAELGVADHPVEPHVRDLVHEHRRGCGEACRIELGYSMPAAESGSRGDGEGLVRERRRGAPRGRRSPRRCRRPARPRRPRPPAARPTVTRTPLGRRRARRW